MTHNAELEEPLGAVLRLPSEQTDPKMALEMLLEALQRHWRPGPSTFAEQQGGAATNVQAESAACCS